MRGIAGGFVLGVPLVYTQEVWFHGGNLSPLAILSLLAASFLLNLALSTAVGFNSGRTKRPFEDAIVGFGLSFHLAAFLLLLLRRIDLDMGWGPKMGIIALSAVPISLGFALGNSLAPKEGGKLEEESRRVRRPAGRSRRRRHAGPEHRTDGGAAPAGGRARKDPADQPGTGGDHPHLRYGLLRRVRRKTPRTEIERPHPYPADRDAARLPGRPGGGGRPALGLRRISGHRRPTLAKSVVLAFPASLGAALGRLLV